MRFENDKKRFEILKLIVPRNRIELVFLLVIIAWGFFLRFYGLGEQSFWIDEGFTISQAKAIAEHGYPLLDSGNIELKDALFAYLEAPLLNIFGNNEFALRFLPALFGGLTIMLIFILGKTLFNSGVGIFASAAISFSYWSIAWSRQARGYSMMFFFVVLGMIFLVLSKKRVDGNRFFYAAGIFFMLAFFLKSFAAIFVFLYIMYSIFEKRYFFTLISLSLAVVIAVPFIFLIINSFNVTGLNYSANYIFGYVWPYFGLLAPMAMIGFYYALTNDPSKRIHFFMLSSLIFSISFLSFFVYINQNRYLLMILPIISIYAGYFIINWTFKKEIKGVSIIFIFLTFAIADSLTANHLKFFPSKNYELEWYTPTPNFKQSIRWIETMKDRNEGKSYIVSAYPFMNGIYGDKADFAIPISYTGRDDDTTVRETEYYSGIPKIKGDEELDAFEKILDLRSKGNVYVLLDRMAMSRMDPELIEYIIDDYDDIFKSEDKSWERIFVYEFSKR